MRIAMMTDAYKPHISGITNYIELNKRLLEDAGHEVFIFTFGNRGFADTESNVIRSPGLPLLKTGYYASPAYSREAVSLLKSMDVAHIHHPFLSGQLSLRTCKPAGIPTLFTNHTRYDIYARFYTPFLPAPLMDGFMKAYMPHFTRQVNRVICPSKGIAGVLKNFGVKARMTIAPNGVDVARFLAPPNQPDPTRFGLPPGAIPVVYSGRLSPEKNLPVLLQAFLLAAGQVPDLHLLLIGAGPLEGKLRQQAAASNFAERIHFTGHLPYQQLPGILALGNIYATASISEVHPLSVIEAMAAGLPVVGIQSVGVGDIVIHGQNGLLAEHNTARDLAEHLTHLGQNAALRKRLGAQARQDAMQYDIRTTSRTMLGIYEELIAEKNGRAA